MGCKTNQNAMRMKILKKVICVALMMIAGLEFASNLYASNSQTSTESSSMYDRGKELWSGNAVKWVREETNNKLFWDKSQTIYIVVYRDANGELTAYYNNRPLSVYTCSRNNQGYTHYVSVDSADWYFKLP